MTLNYLKLSFRLMARNPFFTLINVVGLSVGFAVFFVLWQYSSYELKSDQHHKDHNRIFRLYGDFYTNTGVDWMNYLFGAFPPSFTTIAEQKFTEIESTTRIIHQQNFDEVRWAGRNTFAKMSVRLGGQMSDELVSKLRQKFNTAFPEDLFHWYFLDEHMNVHYTYERATRNQMILFTLIAICLACLGLLGMVSNKTVEKTKEIGIRKVLGAGGHQIAQLLLNATARQILLASAIGVPIANLLTQQYLQQFSERIDLQWWHFALPVVILVLIMLTTVKSVVWRAAKSNPVGALKQEQEN